MERVVEGGKRSETDETRIEEDRKGDGASGHMLKGCGAASTGRKTIFIGTRKRETTDARRDRC